MKPQRLGLYAICVFGFIGTACIQPTDPRFKSTDAGQTTGSGGGNGSQSDASAPPSSGGSGGSGTSSGGSTGSGGAGAGSGETGSGGSSGGSGGSLGSGGSSSGSGGSLGSGGSSSGSGGSSTGSADAGTSGGSSDGGGSGSAGGDSMAAFQTLYDDVFKPNCGPGCHLTKASGGLDMKDAKTMLPLLVGVDSKQCKGMKRVTANDPDNSLVSVIVKGMAMGCKLGQMPENKPMLPAETIAKIDAWIKTLPAN